MDYKEYAKGLVNDRDNIIAAYGYGSCFSHQSGYSEDTKKSIDLIFVVDDIKKWNKNNFKLQENDYSRYTKAMFNVLPKRVLTSGTSVIYNVVTGRYDVDFKYGLIEKERLIHDLYSWDHFYICGRMQKPTYVIKGNSEIDGAIEYNRKSALLVSLLMIDQDIVRIDDLLEMICRLSYMGDVRTLFAENPNKVRNIVNGSKELLMDMYLNSEYIYDIKGQHLFINMDKVYSDKKYLPHHLVEYCEKIYKKKSNITYCLEKYIKSKNIKESMIHPIKQFSVSGFSTCKKYMSEKMKKKSLK